MFKSWIALRKSRHRMAWAVGNRSRLANLSPTPPGGWDTEGGYGVRNICDRLRIVYGEPYGLFCESVLGEGTKVTVLLPAIGPEEE